MGRESPGDPVAGSHWAWPPFCAPLVADPWPLGTYRCAVRHAVGLQVYSDRLVEGRVKPDPAAFTMTLAPLAADCGSISVAHTTVGIALRCTASSTTAEVGSQLGGTLYQWAYPGPTYINVQGTTKLQLGRDGTSFMWTFTTSDYASTYHGSCAPAR